jgi:hypothetical protein
VAKILVKFIDGAEKEVRIGAFAQIAAKRRYGVAAIMEATFDPEVSFFSAFVELVGPAAAKDPAAFDTWLLGVEDIELVKPASELDPTAAEELPAPLPDSPPTSD